MEWTQIIVAAITALASIAAAVIAKKTGETARKTAEESKKTAEETKKTAEESQKTAMAAEKTAAAVVDLMRNEITKIYYKRQDIGELYEHERESLDKLYQGYHAAGGNSFVDDIYTQMRTWKVVGSGKNLGSGREGK